MNFNNKPQNERQSNTNQPKSATVKAWNQSNWNPSQQPLQDQPEDPTRKPKTRRPKFATQYIQPIHYKLTFNRIEHDRWRDFEPWDNVRHVNQSSPSTADASGQDRSPQKKSRRERKAARKLQVTSNEHERGERKTHTSDVVEKSGEEDVKGFKDDKLSVLTVSTATSDRLKKPEEEIPEIDNGKNKSPRGKPRRRERKKNNGKKDDSEKILEVVLHGEQGNISIKVSEDEGNYENLLRDICTAHNICGRTELYFKINILKAIQEVLKAPQAILEDYLNQLLDQNLELIKMENNVSGGPYDGYYDHNVKYQGPEVYHYNSQPSWLFNFNDYKQLQGI